MAKLTSKSRNAIPSKDFAGPDRTYPIENRSHARDALARASADASPALQSRIRAAVDRKYPDMGRKSKRATKRSSKRK